MLSRGVNATVPPLQLVSNLIDDLFNELKKGIAYMYYISKTEATNIAFKFLGLVSI